MGAKLPQPGWRVRCDPLETLTPATGALHGPAPARGQLGSLFSPCSRFSRCSLGALRIIGGTLGPRATGLGETGPFQGPHGEARAPARSDTSLRCEGSAAEPRPLGRLFRVLSRSPPRRARLQGQEEGSVPETRFPAPSLPSTAPVGPPSSGQEKVLVQASTDLQASSRPKLQRTGPPSPQRCPWARRGLLVDAEHSRAPPFSSKQGCPGERVPEDSPLTLLCPACLVTTKTQGRQGHRAQGSRHAGQTQRKQPFF